MFNPLTCGSFLSIAVPNLQPENRLSTASALGPYDREEALWLTGFALYSGARWRYGPAVRNSPQLNPDELVWNHLKNHDISKRVIESSEHLKKMIMAHLQSLQKTPGLIRAFFQAPDL
jgi:hypothetical protein